MKYSKAKIVDTFDDFMEFWSRVRLESLERQIQLWHEAYMANYPELLKKQVESYEENGFNWQEIAKKHVFPQLGERVPLMKEARRTLLTVCTSIHKKACRKLNLDFDIVYVIYVGIGCGAGWATRYAGKPAILLGLENIAELRWHTKNRLSGLIAHEIGHLLHMAWRGEWERFEELEEQDPFFMLYSEGFAQRCEHIILGKESWHQAQSEDWISWCRQNKGWLAREFLKRVENGESLREFFGSWFSIQGKKFTGYFLGHGLIVYLEEENSLKEIALFSIEEVKEKAINYLKILSATRT